MLRLFAILAAALLAPAAGMASQCHAFVKDAPGLRYASLDARLAQAAGEVRITFVGHSSFRIETPGGVSIVTDYFGDHGHGPPPAVVTMNKAHSTHYTTSPHPEIEHVLKGWGDEPDQPAEHLLEVGDVTIRNVTTDIRGWAATPEKDGNSIFVFEVADLCIGHLGHLHHIPSEPQYALIGQLDIVMAPVDGSWTLGVEDMVEVLQRLKARLVLPMHAFSESTMRRFIDGLAPEFAFEVADTDTLAVSVETLPSRPTVLLMHERLVPGPD